MVKSTLQLGLLVALGMALACTTPTLAQPASPLEDLRQTDLCLLRVGGFVALTKAEHSPSSADLSLLKEMYQVADRLIYRSEVLISQVGEPAQDGLIADLMPGWNQSLKHGDGEPNKAAILRADLTPGLKACIQSAKSLPNRP